MLFAMIRFGLGLLVPFVSPLASRILTVTSSGPVSRNAALPLAIAGIKVHAAASVRFAMHPKPQVFASNRKDCVTHLPER